LKGLPGSPAKELDQPGHRMDRHALRAIVNGALHGDSALVSADQLMAAPPRPSAFQPPGIPAVTPVLGGKSGVAGLIEKSARIIEAGPGASSAVLSGGLHRVPGLRGRERAWLFRGSDLKKKSGFRRLVCWRWRAGAGDNVA
jgi:hypothetical protein